MAISGTPGNDNLIGTDVDDTLFGSLGNDTIDGLAGIDRLEYFQIAPITYNLVPGTIDKPNGQQDQIFNIERIIVNPFSAGLPNLIDARQGTNELSSLTVDLRAGSPFVGENNLTLINSSVSDFSIRVDNFKDVIGSVGNDNIIGNDLNNRLDGFTGNDSIAGAVGDDDISGGAGNDLLTGSGGNDTVNGGFGNDTIAGGDRISPSRSANDLDTLTGGFGADRFELGSIGSPPFPGGSFYTGTGFATITDFVTGIDTIVLFGTANQYVFAGNNTIFIDTNANGIADPTVDNQIAVLQTGTFNPNTTDPNNTDLVFVPV